MRLLKNMKMRMIGERFDNDGSVYIADIERKVIMLLAPALKVIMLRSIPTIGLLSASHTK